MTYYALRTMKSDFKEGRRGLAFKDGKLFEFTKRHVLVLSPWPDPRAWFKRTKCSLTGF
jgi:hypothetical protein